MEELTIQEMTSLKGGLAAAGSMPSGDETNLAQVLSSGNTAIAAAVNVESDSNNALAQFGSFALAGQGDIWQKAKANAGNQFVNINQST
jgi:hypothetical protein